MMTYKQRRALFSGCGDFRVRAVDPQPMRIAGMEDDASIETLHKFYLYALLPVGLDLAEGDLARASVADGWGHIATAMIYTRPLGRGRLLPVDLSDTERCYLDVSDGLPQPLARFGAAPSGASAFRISRIQIARSWRGRGLGRRLLRDVLTRVPEQAFVLGLDPEPKAPEESDRGDEEARRFVERFWASAGFRACSDDPRTWTALWTDVVHAMAGVQPLE